MKAVGMKESEVFIHKAKSTGLGRLDAEHENEGQVSDVKSDRLWCY